MVLPNRNIWLYNKYPVKQEKQKLAQNVHCAYCNLRRRRGRGILSIYLSILIYLYIYLSIYLFILIYLYIYLS